MWLRIRSITEPGETPVTVPEAKTHLRVDGTDDDTFILALISAVVAHVEGPNGIGAPVISRQWELTLDGFPCQIQIPMTNITSVDSIVYTDTDGVDKTLAASEYQVDLKGDPVRIEPAYSKTWPSTRAVLGAVTVTFTAGYATAADVPEDLKAGLKLLLGHWYEHREEVTVGTELRTLPFAAQSIFERYRVGRFG